MTETDDGLADAFADPRLAGLLAELEALAHGPVPEVGDDLTALLDGTVRIVPSASRGSRAASLAVAGLIAGGVLAGGVGAAAADVLPEPVQRVVSRVVSTLTPLELPHPDRTTPDRGQGPVSPDVPTPTDEDDHATDDGAGAPTVPTPAPTPSRERDDVAEGSGGDSHEADDSDGPVDHERDSDDREEREDRVGRTGSDDALEAVEEASDEEASDEGSRHEEDGSDGEDRSGGDRSGGDQD